MPIEIIVILVLLIILLLIMRSISMRLRVMPSLTWTRCSMSGDVSSSQRAVAVSTSSAMASSLLVPGGTRLQMPTNIQRFGLSCVMSWMQTMSWFRILVIISKPFLIRYNYETKYSIEAIQPQLVYFLSPDDLVYWLWWRERLEDHWW